MSHLTMTRNKSALYLNKLLNLVENMTVQNTTNDLSSIILILLVLRLLQHRPSNLKDKLNKVKFWKRADGGEKYEVSMHPGDESVA